jgi:hypothetical protein
VFFLLVLIMLIGPGLTGRWWILLGVGEEPGSIEEIS